MKIVFDSEEEKKTFCSGSDLCPSYFGYKDLEFEECREVVFSNDCAKCIECFERSGMKLEVAT